VAKNLLRWYGDNSELLSLESEAQVPNILFFGGIGIEADTERALKAEFLEIKRTYGGHGQYPLKWNFSELKPKFTARNAGSLFDKVYKDQPNWRRRVLECVARHECWILISCLHCYGQSRESLKQTRPMLFGTVFGNSLMRFALLVKEQKPQSAEVVLDWPDGAKPDPFDDEFRSAYKDGCSATDRNVVYHAGKLSLLPFSESPLYSRTLFNPLLQLSDIVLGVTREFIQGVDRDSPPSDLFSIILPRLYGYPSRIGRGINFSPPRGSLANKVRTEIEKLVLGAVRGLQS
jgi:hypothetical protein